MSAWRRFGDDPWADDDPAVRRGREALTLGNGPQTAPDAPQRPDVPEPVPLPTPPDTEAPRRNRVAELVGRVRAGDLSAVDMLRDLLDRK